MKKQTKAIIATILSVCTIFGIFYIAIFYTKFIVFTLAIIIFCAICYMFYNLFMSILD